MEIVGGKLTHSISIEDDWTTVSTSRHAFDQGASKLTLFGSLTSTSYPEASVEEGVAFIARLKLDGDAKFVLASWNGVGLSSIVQAFQHVLRSCSPALCCSRDKRRRFIICL